MQSVANFAKPGVSLLRKGPKITARASLVVVRAVDNAPITDVKVEEVMSTDVYTLNPGDSTKDALKLFLEKNITGAPVVDNEKRLVGFISEMDLIWKETVPDAHWIIPPIYLPFIDALLAVQDEKSFKEEARRVLAKTVGEAMSNQPVTVRPDMKLSEAASVMLHKKFARLPVVEDGRVVGMLCRRDVLRSLLLERNPYLS